uniref:YqgE/AlgH family protein n=1 Tax=Chlamydomonas leiostraca TaxID=1034604 RepID=A0A7S0S201_9CHLO|eukprot:CAMPEP_0202865710 /NCGR_PEP_ID=MMETSP1391-20130828/6309_1 /ASSEMBLY_ACC=CAM_ASM_000867 /TAXON_ID=1034604 /ORGANISM="Chlamydomonas leiostraca, Strain SAG 11-49" /LENGTH=336 /DNA_ID=CAMNT_0049545577 /DNA_START=55 /DNA_END=1065 /DNA_ORIENTATION=-
MLAKHPSPHIVAKRCCPIQVPFTAVQPAGRTPKVLVCRDSKGSSSSSGSGSGSSEKSESFQHPELAGSSTEDAGSPLVLPAGDMDWREFRARLVARTAPPDPFAGAASTSGSAGQVQVQEPGAPGVWAHSIPKPEKGSLLLAHPMMFTNSQEYFFQAVILLLDHDNSKGSWGIILNRPSMYTLGKLELTHPLPEFASCPLHVGGDVGGGDVAVLHARTDLPLSKEVVKGVHLGGVDAARELVAAGKADPLEFKWYVKYAGWGPGQLESECKAGVWFTAAASARVILGEARASDGCDRWHEVLGLMGGDYAELSMNVRAAEERRRGGRPAGEGGPDA